MIRCKEAKQNLLLSAVKHYKKTTTLLPLSVFMIMKNLIQ